MPVPCGDLAVPVRIELNDKKDGLLWFPQDGLKSVVPDMHDLLDGFVSLSGTQTPTRFLNYARKWGLLYLSEQGTPCCWWGTTQRPRSEPLATWRYWAKRARAVLNIAESLKLRQPKTGKRASPTDWEALDGLEGRVGGDVFDDLRRHYGIIEGYARYGTQDSHAWDLQTEHLKLAREITLWKQLGRLGVGLNEATWRLEDKTAFQQYLDSPDIAWRLENDYRGFLFSAIAHQLVLTVIGKKLFICSACGETYQREGKAPKRGERNYCERCGLRATMYAATERKQKRIAQAQLLHQKGKSAEEIAKLLQIRGSKRSTPVQTARRWLRESKVRKDKA